MTPRVVKVAFLDEVKEADVLRVPPVKTSDAEGSPKLLSAETERVP
jgi:hypothetical protein